MLNKGFICNKTSYYMKHFLLLPNKTFFIVYKGQISPTNVLLPCFAVLCLFAFTVTLLYLFLLFGCAAWLLHTYLSNCLPSLLIHSYPFSSAHSSSCFPLCPPVINCWNKDHRNMRTVGRREAESYDTCNWDAGFCFQHHGQCMSFS